MARGGAGSSGGVALGRKNAPGVGRGLGRGCDAELGAAGCDPISQVIEAAVALFAAEGGDIPTPDAAALLGPARAGGAHAGGLAGLAFLQGVFAGSAWLFWWAGAHRRRAAAMHRSKSASQPMSDLDCARIPGRITTASQRPFGWSLTFAG